MKRATKLAGMAAAAGLSVLAYERPAAACGGCFHPPTQVASDITDERMLLSVSPTQTTLYDQIRYSGSPTSFAWVLPIHGTVQVALSADVLFDSMDALTATQIVAPASKCPPPPNCGQRSGYAVPSVEGAKGSDGVTVTKQENVGPYATVQLHATDSKALEKWLADNGFEIPADVKPTIAEYVSEHFDFLAMKLLPNQGIQAMRPVRITSPGASLSMPLRMAAIGTGVTVGITIWVVSDGRYEPQNYPFFRIDDAALVWDWQTSLSNYAQLRADAAAKLGGKGWEIESSLTLNQQTIGNVILSGGQPYVGASAANAAEDYLPVPGTDAGAPAETAEQVRTADVAALFAGMSVPNVRVTRMRSDISHAAMTTDLVLQASADQSEISNVHNVTASINETCTLYDGCDAKGTGTLAEAQTSAAASGGGCGVITPGRTTGVAAALLLGGLGLVASRLLRRRSRP